MHIITRKRLNDFAYQHPETRGALEHWYKTIKKANFSSFPDLRKVFPYADQVENLTVFNIGGNKVRLIVPFITIDKKFIFVLYLHIKNIIKINGGNNLC